MQLNLCKLHPFVFVCRFESSKLSTSKQMLLGRFDDSRFAIDKYLPKAIALQLIAISISNHAESIPTL